MSNRAPENMPTETLRNMIRFAEQQVTDWSRSADDHRRRLGVAEAAADRYEADAQRYREQLATRLNEEYRND